MIPCHPLLLVFFDFDGFGIGRFLPFLLLQSRFLLQEVVEGDEHRGDFDLILGEPGHPENLQEAEEVVEHCGQQQ